MLSSDLVVSGNYAGVEFLVLSEYKLLFTMAKYENSSYNYYKHLYYFPYCVSNSIIINNGEQYPIQNIFNSNLSKNELTEHTFRILFVTLPNIGAILNGSSSISSGNIYAITSLKYSSNLSGATSFRYKGVENSAFSQTFYSNECTLNIIVCYESCKTCSTSGTSSKHNCNLCDNDKGFYNREIEMYNLGFDKCYFANDVNPEVIEDIYRWNGSYPLDSEFIELVIDDMIPNKSNTPFYSFYTTFSMHGPYDRNGKNYQKFIDLGYYKKLEEAKENNKWENICSDDSEEIQKQIEYLQCAMMDFDYTLGRIIERL